MRTGIMVKMAADERKSGSIFKGMKLTVVVEEASNDVIVVVLHHASKSYRGVLLHSTESSWNYTSFKDRSDCEVANGVNKPVDMPATIFRHTYFPNVTNSNMNTQDMPQRSFPKLGNNRTTRNIRLRPRQTLCSQCKSTCLESQNGPIPISSAVASSPSKQQTAKLDIKPHKKKTVGLDNVMEPKPTKLIRVNSDTKLTRTSPFIKISIGETNVMNIPPRLHPFDRQISSDTEKSAEDELDDNETVVKTESNSYKRMLRHSQDERSYSDENKKRRNTSSQNRKSKRDKTRSKEFDESDNDLPPNIIITENVDTSEDSEDLGENGETKKIDCARPRLIYTWRQNKGLSPMHISNITDDQIGRRSESPNEILPSPLENLDGTPLHEMEEKKNKPSKKTSRKEYKLRSRSRSLDSNPEYEITEDSAYISYEDPKSVSDRSEGCSTEVESATDSDSDYEDGPPGEEHVDAFKPLMMKIHTTSVSKCSIPDGRKLHTGDIVWGKVKGFPWWPGRIMTINVSQKDNAVVIRQIAQVAWFGSSTMSHISCTDLYPFLQEFKVRFNRKKRSTPYRRAIKQATIAAQMCEPHNELNIEEFDVS